MVENILVQKYLDRYGGTLEKKKWLSHSQACRLSGGKSGRRFEITDHCDSVQKQAPQSFRLRTFQVHDYWYILRNPVQLNPFWGRHSGKNQSSNLWIKSNNYRRTFAVSGIARVRSRRTMQIFQLKAVTSTTAWSRKLQTLTDWSGLWKCKLSRQTSCK